MCLIILVDVTCLNNRLNRSFLVHVRFLSLFGVTYTFVPASVYSLASLTLEKNSYHVKKFVSPGIIYM